MKLGDHPNESVSGPHSSCAGRVVIPLQAVLFDSSQKQDVVRRGVNGSVPTTVVACLSVYSATHHFKKTLLTLI